MEERRDAIRAWLERRFGGNDYRVKRALDGTYGTVWILETELQNAHPRGFAVKTFRADKTVRGIPLDVRALFERELALWIRLPQHLNVVASLGFEFMHTDGEPIPMVRMPLMVASLRDWVQDASVSSDERLAALAHLCNGLAWLYENGIEGHGDLKPENVLLRNLSADYALAPGIPTWLAKVADLGWADIWRDLEGPDAVRRGWQPYVAPERMEGTFVPCKSDMFAVGVIGVELLGGVHPGGAETASVGRWNANKYRSWARSTTRSIPDSIPVEVARVLRACLSSDPFVRPMPHELIAVLAANASPALGYDVGATLELYTCEARKMRRAGDAAWAAEVAGDLGNTQVVRSIEELTSTHDMPLPLPIRTDADAERVARWLSASCAMSRLLVKRGTSDDRDRAAAVSLRVLQLLADHADTLDLRRPLYLDPTRDTLYISDLEAWEVTLQFAQEASRTLQSLELGNDERVTGLTAALRAKLGR